MQSLENTIYMQQKLHRQLTPNSEQEQEKLENSLDFSAQELEQYEEDQYEEVELFVEEIIF